MAQTYLAFDFGLKRIGVAQADSITGQARALATLPSEWSAVTRLVQDWRPDHLIVGLPLTLDGGEQEITATARRFARRLAHEFRLPVSLCDERMSSLAAQDMLRAQRASGERRRRLKKQDIDSHAARVILQQWLDGESKEHGLDEQPAD